LWLKKDICFKALLNVSLSLSHPSLRGREKKNSAVGHPKVIRTQQEAQQAKDSKRAKAQDQML